MTRPAILLLLALIPFTVQAGETFGPYRAILLRVLDGDTVQVRVGIWPGLTETVKVRLAGIDAPELRAKTACERKAARDALEFTRRMVTEAALLTVEEVRLDKYGGRIVGKLLADRRDVSQALLTAGLARPYRGGKREPWC